MIAFSGQGLYPSLLIREKPWWARGRSQITSNRLIRSALPVFSSPGGKVFARYMEFWSDSVLMPGLMPLIIVDLFNHLHQKDRDYFRSSRERKLGMSLEQAGAHRESRLARVSTESGGPSYYS